MIVGGGKGRLVCSYRRERGPTICAEGRSVRSDVVEARVVTAIKGLLLDPMAIEAAVREHQALSGQRTRTARAARAERQAAEKELAEVKRRAVGLVDQVADGALSGAAVKDRLDLLEQRRSELEVRLEAAPTEPDVMLHPVAPARSRQLVERLAEVLTQHETLEIAEAHDALSALIRSVVVTERPERSAFDVTVETDLTPLTSGGSSLTLGAGTGFEPVTFRL